MLKAIADFSKKFSRFSESGETERKAPLSSDEILQQKINDSEKERREKLVSRLKAFMEPFSKETETDEENLLKAWNLFSEVKHINEEKGDRNTSLSDLSIKSPVCSKSEYFSGEGFAFLKVWFVIKNPDAGFVPEIQTDSHNSRRLLFTPSDEAKFSPFEKELLSLFSAT